MRWRRWILMLLGCAAVGVVTVALSYDREPRYHGRSLSKWLVLARTAADGRAEVEARQAVREIGTNALPWLVGWARCEDSHWRARISPYYFLKLPKRYHTLFLDRFLVSCSPYIPRQKALMGFAILRSEAFPAVPQLEAIAHDTRKSMYVRCQAVLCLGYIGNAAGRALATLAQDQDMTLAKYAQREIESRFPDSQPPVPITIRGEAPYYLRRE